MQAFHFPEGIEGMAPNARVVRICEKSPNFYRNTNESRNLPKSKKEKLFQALSLTLAVHVSQNSLPNVVTKQPRKVA